MSPHGHVRQSANKSIIYLDGHVLLPSEKQNLMHTSYWQGRSNNKIHEFKHWNDSLENMRCWVRRCICSTQISQQKCTVLSCIIVFCSKFQTAQGIRKKMLSTEPQNKIEFVCCIYTDVTPSIQNIESSLRYNSIDIQEQNNLESFC